MSIPASNIVRVEPRVIRALNNNLVLNGLLLSLNDRTSATDMVLEFTNASDVGSYFGTESVEYVSAVRYFSGYLNKFTSPRSFFIALRVDQAIAAWLRSKSYTGTLNSLKSITNGGLDIIIDDTVHSIRDVDFSEATSFSNVAEILTTALEGVATVTFSSIDNSFTIKSDTTGETSTIEYASSPKGGGTAVTTFTAHNDTTSEDIEGTLTITSPPDENVAGTFTPGSFTQTSATETTLTGEISFNLDDFEDGTISVGDEVIITVAASNPTLTTSSITTPLGTITFANPERGGAAVTVDISFVQDDIQDLATILGFRQDDGAVISQGMEELSVTDQMTAILEKTQNFITFTTAWEAATEEILQWASWSSANYGWLYCAYTTIEATATQSSTTDPASMLKDGNYDHTCITYGDLKYTAFLMGTIASIDYYRLNGTITTAFKRQATLNPYVTSNSVSQALESKNCNYYGNWATRNAEFSFFYPGKMCSSDYNFIDSYINSVWLNNYIQVSCMNGFVASPRVPYNTVGYTKIRAWLSTPIQRAKDAGVIDNGVSLTDAQIQEIQNEAGIDISVELETQGFYLQILDPGAEIRYARESPIINFWYTYGGAVHRIDIVSTAIL